MDEGGSKMSRHAERHPFRCFFFERGGGGQEEFEDSFCIKACALHCQLQCRDL